MCKEKKGVIMVIASQFITIQCREDSSQQLLPVARVTNDRNGPEVGGIEKSERQKKILRLENSNYMKIKCFCDRRYFRFPL